MLGNARADPCSKILKRRFLDAWRVANCSTDCTVVIGFDATEGHRLDTTSARMGADLKCVAAATGARQSGKRAGPRHCRGGRREAAAPLCDGLPPQQLRAASASRLAKRQFAMLLELMPARYAEHEGKGRGPSAPRSGKKETCRSCAIAAAAAVGRLTMRAFRERHEREPTFVDRFDFWRLLVHGRARVTPEAGGIGSGWIGRAAGAHDREFTVRSLELVEHPGLKPYWCVEVMERFAPDGGKSSPRPCARPGQARPSEIPVPRRVVPARAVARHTGRSPTAQTRRRLDAKNE